MRDFVPVELLQAGIPLTTGGDYPADGVAEGAMTLLLAVLKGLHHRIEVVRNDGWEPVEPSGGSLKDMTVGVYGCGVICRRFIKLLRPFGARIVVFDPYLTDVPRECRRVDSLDALFAESQAIVIHASLTPETAGSVTAALLAKLPAGGIVINTARGGLIDQDALF